MTMPLPDPRQYARMDPKQPLLRRVMSHLTQAHQPDSLTALQNEVRDSLLSGQDDLLQQALQTVPAQEAYEALWAQVCQLVDGELLSRPDGKRARLFMLPLILVAGARQEVTVPATLPDATAVKALLQQHGVLADSNQVWLSDTLCDLPGMDAIPASTWYQAMLSIQQGGHGLPLSLPAAPLLVKGNEGVHVRCLIGLALEQPGESLVRLGGDAQGWGLALCKLLQTQWQQSGLTLFVMPRPLCGVMAGRHDARFTCLEVAFQLFASTQIRKVREGVGDPAAVLACHEGGELRVSLGSVLQPALRERFVWRLSALDRVASIQQMMEGLLQECQVTDIRRVHDVQPALGPDGQPLFLDLDQVPMEQVVH